ncbi:hypothetical protein V2J09_012404 [Rumex salicifolius]
MNKSVDKTVENRCEQNSNSIISSGLSSPTAKFQPPSSQASMATLNPNPSLLNTIHSNSSHFSSSFSVDFKFRCLNLLNSRCHSGFLSIVTKSANSPSLQDTGIQHRRSRRLKQRKLIVKASEGENTSSNGRSFLSFEEAGLVEMSGLSTHERFLCRLTISSLNLLRVIGEQEGCTIEELNAGRVCDWFLKDKLKREQDIGSAVLQWEEDDFDDLQS